VAGGFFVAVAAIAVVAISLSSGRGSGRPWVVATQTLPAGATLAAGDLGTEVLSLPPNGVGATAFSGPAALVGRVLAAPLATGELVQSGDLASPGGATALRPVTVTVAASDLDDLSPGSLIDVLVTNGTDPSSPTLVVVGDARVLSLGRAATTLDGAAGEVTVGLRSLDEVTAVVHAAHTGTLSVVAGAPGDAASPGAGGTFGSTSSGASTPGGGGSGGAGG
jgi:Flp pilus assembly protein CpaB